MVPPKLPTVAGSSAFPLPTTGSSSDEHERFWRLWSERYTDLRERCLRWLRGQPADVEEIMSVTALKAAEYLNARPASVRNMSPWVSRILHNACIDRLNEHARLVPLDDHQLCPGQPALRKLTETPEHRVHRHQLGRSIIEAVETLPPKLRAAFVLRFIEELPYEEIASLLSITPQNARKRIQKARQRLRANLQPVSPQAS